MIEQRKVKTAISMNIFVIPVVYFLRGGGWGRSRGVEGSAKEEDKLTFYADVTHSRSLCRNQTNVCVVGKIQGESFNDFFFQF